MKLTLNTIGLVLNIIGCIFIFCESLKMGVHYDENGNPVPGVDTRQTNCFWRHIGRIGLVLLIFGFIFQVVSNFIYQ
jgi:hypothetical protein